MKLLFVADGRSPTSRAWITYFIRQGYQVHLVSTSPSKPIAGLTSSRDIALAPSGRSAGSASRVSSLIRGLTAPRFRMVFQRFMAGMNLGRRALQLREVISRLQPDLVHAMRIPFEGILAAAALDSRPEMAMRNIPLVISVWGNDFTLHAQASRWMAANTRKALDRASGLIADCQRDIRLSHQWGFPTEAPTRVLPGGGGVRPEIFYPAESTPEAPLQIIQPRGLRAYVENEAFLQAVPHVLKVYPHTRFVCPGLGESETLSAAAGRINIAASVDLLPRLPQRDLGKLFRRSAILLSPTTHDGTPNSLLEGLACGCFPVAGDLESIREWIKPGINGLLTDPRSPTAIAAALVEAIGDRPLREKARDFNLALVSDKALYSKVMPRAAAFYAALI